MTTYFVDSSIKKSGDGLTLETAFKDADEAWDIVKRNAPQNQTFTIEKEKDKEMSKILNPLKLIDRLKARFRLWDEACPRCNSDAPAVDTCWVCWHGNFVGKENKTTLRNRWKIWRTMKEKEPRILK